MSAFIWFAVLSMTVWFRLFYWNVLGLRTIWADPQAGAQLIRTCAADVDLAKALEVHLLQNELAGHAQHLGLLSEESKAIADSAKATTFLDTLHTRCSGHFGSQMKHICNLQLVKTTCWGIHFCYFAQIMRSDFECNMHEKNIFSDSLRRNAVGLTSYIIILTGFAFASPFCFALVIAMGQCSTQDAVGPQLQLRGLTFGRDSMGSKNVVGKMQRIFEHFARFLTSLCQANGKQWSWNERLCTELSKCVKDLPVDLQHNFQYFVTVLTSYH